MLTLHLPLTWNQARQWDTQLFCSVYTMLLDCGILVLFSLSRYTFCFPSSNCRSEYLKCPLWRYSTVHLAWTNQVDEELIYCGTFAVSSLWPALCLLGGIALHSCTVDLVSLNTICSQSQISCLSNWYVPCLWPYWACPSHSLTLKVLNFWKFTSYCSLNSLWSGMGEVVPARTSPTLHPPSPPTVHQLSQLAL